MGKVFAGVNNMYMLCSFYQFVFGHHSIHRTPNISVEGLTSETGANFKSTQAKLRDNATIIENFPSIFNR